MDKIFKKLAVLWRNLRNPILPFLGAQYRWDTHLYGTLPCGVRYRHDLLIAPNLLLSPNGTDIRAIMKPSSGQPLLVRQYLSTNLKAVRLTWKSNTPRSRSLRLTHTTNSSESSPSVEVILSANCQPHVDQGHDPSPISSSDRLDRFLAFVEAGFGKGF
ncbi:hypothetical protein V3481_019580 [Fusarium oxysporum f. sp. vasinfectum]